MHLGIRTKLVCLFFLISAIVAANFLLIRYIENETSEHLKRVNRKHEVIFSSERFLGAIRDAETGQRGYLLTQDPKYLVPYDYGVQLAFEEFTALLTLTLENSAQQQSLKRIENLKKEKFAELAQTILLVSEGKIENALAIVKGDEGQRLMELIRAEMDQFQTREAQLLTQSKNEYQQSQELLRFLFGCEVLLLILLILFMSLYIQRKLIIPLYSMVKATKGIESGAQELTLNPNKMTDEMAELAQSIIVMHESIKERTKDLQDLSEELEKERDIAVLSSVTDSLTGLYNRRQFQEIGNNEYNRSRREGNYFHLIIMDIDYFKEINDQYGHAYGDEVLQKVAKCLKTSARRPNDFVFRIGGEEFVYLTSDENKYAADYAQMIRTDVEALLIPNPASNVSDFLTMSLGLVTSEPNGSESFKELLIKADKRLYLAKRSGRNCVVSSNKE